MRKFLRQVALVVSLTLAVSVTLALTTGSTGPADNDKPAAANDDDATADEKTVEASHEAEAGQSDDGEPDITAGDTSDIGTPDHLTETGTADDAEVLGITVAQESGSELADTGFTAVPALLIAVSMVTLGFGVHLAARRPTRVPART